MDLNITTTNSKDGFSLNTSLDLRVDISQAYVRLLIFELLKFFILFKTLRFQYQLTALVPNPIMKTQYMTVMNMTDDVCKSLNAKTRTYIVKLLLEVFDEEVRKLAKCPFKRVRFCSDCENFTQIYFKHILRVFTKKKSGS